MAALHEAIQDWNDEQIRWLLDHHADVNALDEQGNTPLMLAASQNIYREDLDGLLERGADFHARNAEGMTALMLALDHSALDSAAVLLEQYAQRGEEVAIDQHFEQGRLALLWAIYNSDLAAIHAALDAGADINVRNRFGHTPLMFAAKVGHPAAIRVLVEHGADVNAVEAEGNGWTALHIAADAGYAECAQALLELGAELDSRDLQQRTPLIWAAWSAGFTSSASTVRVMLEYGADIHAEDAEGYSALTDAARLADEETIRLLLAWGAGKRAEHLHKAFHACFVDNNQDKAPLFLEAGVKIGLSEAILLKEEERIQRMLEEGVDTEEINRALLTAASHADANLVRSLLKHGADPNASYDGQTALMQAYNNLWRQRSIILTLLEAGADVNARNANGETPFTTRSGWSMDEARVGN